jgi:hypothetical protein
MNEIIKIIIENWELSTSIGGFTLVGIDYLVKHSKNKIDDAIWNKIKLPLVKFIKEYFKNKNKQ